MTVESSSFNLSLTRSPHLYSSNLLDLERHARADATTSRLSELVIVPWSVYRDSDDFQRTTLPGHRGSCGRERGGARRRRARSETAVGHVPRTRSRRRRVHANHRTIPSRTARTGPFHRRAIARVDGCFAAAVPTKTVKALDCAFFAAFVTGTPAGSALMDVSALAWNGRQALTASNGRSQYLSRASPRCDPRIARATSRRDVCFQKSTDRQSR